MAYINYGDDFGKLVVIVDIADANRVLVDGGEEFPRVIYPLKRLTLVKLVVPIQRGARTGTLKKATDEFGLKEKWEGTPTFKKITQRETRANLSDWERFKVMRARKNRSHIVKKLVHKAISKKKPAPPKKGASKEKAVV